MDGNGDGDMPVYGGRRRARPSVGTRAIHVIDLTAQPTVQPAVRYYPQTGQIPVVSSPLSLLRGTSPASSPVPLPQRDDIDEATTPRRSMLPPPPPTPSRERAAAPIRRGGSVTTASRPLPTVGPAPATAPPDVPNTARPTPIVPGPGTPPHGVPSPTVAASPSTRTDGTGRTDPAVADVHDGRAIDWTDWAVARPTRRPRQRASRPDTSRPDASRPGASRSERLIPLWIGLGAALLCILGDWLPSLTPSELHLLAVTGRSSDDFWALSQTGHAADALWLATVHHWFALVGASDVAWRILASSTIGVVAAGISTYCLQVAGPRAAVFAGVAFALFPRAVFDGGTVSGAGLGLALVTWAVVASTWAVSQREPLPGTRLEPRLVAPDTRRHRYAACSRNLARWTIFVVLLTLAVYACTPLVVLIVVLPLAKLLGDTNIQSLRALGVSLMVVAVLVVPLFVSIAIGAASRDARATRALISPTDLFFVSLSPVASVSGMLLAVVTVLAAVVIATGLRRTVRTTGTGVLWLGALWMCALAIGALVYPVPVEAALGLWSLVGPCVAVLLGVTLASAPRSVVWTTVSIIAVAAAADLALVQLPGLAESGAMVFHVTV